MTCKNQNLFRIFLSLSVIALFALTSCSDDDDVINQSGDPEEEYNPFVLSLAVQGSEGDFTYYTVPYSDVMSGSLNAEGVGIEQPGYYDFTQINETIYSIGGLDDVDLEGIRKNSEEKKLKEFGNISFQNSLSDLVKADDNTLVSATVDEASNIVKFRKISSDNLSVTEEKDIQVSKFADYEGEGPAYSGMEISGNHLFMSYYISDPDNFDTNHTDTARVAVFSYPELQFEKVITDTRVGPIGGFNVKSGLIKDENGNIYALSHSNPANGFSQSTKPSGILKINSGETEFNDDYFFDIDAVSNGGNTARVKYLKNGKAFAEINTADRENQEKYADGPLRSAVINFESKSVNFIDGVPEHSGDGRRLPALYNGNNIYLSIPDSDGIHVYRMDVNNYTATKGASVEANFVAGFFKL